MREFSLTKHDRLLRSKDYSGLRSGGKKIETDEFIIVYKNNMLKNSRLGITVSKKVGCAVVRNRIKRTVREFFRTNRFLIVESVDMNVISKRSAGSQNNHTLMKSLNEAFIRIDKKINA
ncbi:ribonuclease P protein component [Desulfatiferula olefinivorans]